MINKLYQDRKGFIWIATENGLNKFNGATFTVYRKDPADSTSLKNNYIRTLHEDSSGIFWIGCLDGLMTFDRNTDTFSEVTIMSPEGKRLYPHVTSILESRNGDLWFATSGEGLLLQKKGEQVCSPVAELNKSICSRFLTVLHEDRSGRIWIGSENAGLNMHDPLTQTLSLYTDQQPEGGSLSGNGISAICEGDDGEVFIGTLINGLNKYSDENGFQALNGKGEDSLLPIKSLAYNREEKALYVGTDGKGMKVYREKTGVLEEYEPFFTPFDFSKTKIHSILKDKDGNVWTGIFQKGVFFIPGNPNGFKYFGYKSFKENSIGSNCIMSVYKDADNIVWVGTDYDGMYSIDEKNQQVRHYKGSDTPNSVPNVVTCIKEDANGKLWLGSYLNGFAVFDKKTGACRTFNSKGNYLPEDKVYCVEFDKDGFLWIGTYGGGLYQFDPRTESIRKHYYQHEEGQEGICNNWINTLLYDERGFLWIGTYKGLSCLELKTERFHNYVAGGLSDIPSNTVFALNIDKDQQLWIGTDQGLACLRPNLKTLAVYTSQQGLASNVIYGIEHDDNNHLWVSTIAGISKLEQNKSQIINYYSSDGLQGNEFNRGAHSKAKDGEIYFGGMNGINSFYPQDIHARKRKPSVFITDFYLFGKRISTRSQSGEQAILQQFVLDADKVSLSARDNVFSLDFSTLEYTNPEGTYYKYRLEDFDLDWLQTAPGNNNVTYTNLSPGKYTLYYQACDKDNVSDLHQLSITIRPPWYLTVWAKCVFWAIVLLILFFVYLYTRSKIEYRNEMLRLEHAEEINEAKLQFFINISHEIRTPMTLIMGPLEKLLTENKNPALQNSYLLIYRNAQRILRLINQLIDIRKIDRGQMQLKARETDMVGFIEDIMQAFDYMAKKKNVRFEFIHEMPSLKVWVDLNNFDKVLFNIFSNAFKYTPDGGEIQAILSTGKDTSCHGPLSDYFQIQIIDNGIGIDENQVDRIFERFYQINNSLTNAHIGAGIGLHLSRSLVELQSGKITAKNREDGSGSCFSIRLPLGKSHLKPSEMEIITEDSLLDTIQYAKKDDLFELVPDEEQQSVKAKTSYRILLAEDDTEISNYLKRELSTDYCVIQKSNGKDGLEYVLSEKPDLVISDIMMPEMDGISFCKKIKNNVNTEHIPVILLTAKSSDEDKAEGLDTGADAYIVKPFNVELLKKSVANLIKNRERMKGKFSQQSEGRLEKIELKSSDEILMEKIITIINTNLDNPDLNVEMLSSGVGMSRVHMHRKLKQLTNLPARDFIRSIRLKQAGELLLSKKFSISEVAYSVGFSSPSHFSSSFREFYGLSPKEYIDKQSERIQKRRETE